MVPAVPFALLGVTALLAVAAWAALAGAAVALRGLRLPALLLAAGAALLAVLEVLTAVRFGDASSDRLVLLRAGGALLLTGGLALGALQVSGARDAARTGLPGDVSGVVVPLAAAPVPAVVAGLAMLAAAVSLLRSRRDAPGAALAAGLALSAVAVLAAPLADDGPGRALLVVGLRGLGALAVLAGLALLAQASLLAKVVATTLAGVLAMAAAAVGVVGTVVVGSYDDQASEIVTQTAQSTARSLLDLAPPLVGPTQQLEQGCRRQPESCGGFLAQVADRRTAFAARVTSTGATFAVTGTYRLTAAEQAGVRQLPQVRALLAGRGVGASSALVRLAGDGRLAAVAVAPAPRDSPDVPFPSVLVFGLPVVDELLQDSLRGEDY
ncbi:MAG: hypothetical protein JWM64_498, partial [Frankiales bacterium]|nr:hypothetical protein [Frankiales bacterium]